MITLGIVLAGALNLTAPLEELKYQRMVEIVKVQVAPSKEARRQDLEITFNLVPDMPKGLKIFFELERDQNPVTDESSTPVSIPYVLESENRKSIKLIWTPKARLTCDKYMLKTRIPLAEQSEEVKKAILANPKRFTENSDPWAWLHNYQVITVGTPEQEIAEYKEVKAFIEGKIEAVLELNNEAMEELEKAATGKAHSKAGKLDPDSLRKFMNTWMNSMAKLQKSIGEVVVTDPGFYDTKFLQVHTELIFLSRLIAKRISKVELKKILDKQGLTLGAFKVPTVPDFNPNYNTGTSVEEIKKRHTALKRGLWNAEPGRKLDDLYKDPDEEATEDAPAEPGKDAKDAPKDEPKEPGDAPKAGEEEKQDDSAKPEPSAKKPAPKKSTKNAKKKT